ncbi:hypothetical protein V5O48_002304 [Marasmius crinis-equi]|uniref:Uncharacterized protein n=1 Tax=Marasmius crinis-equi TaxID=585013 RepID=A0ABR3FWA8_9AGAR
MATLWPPALNCGDPTKIIAANVTLSFQGETLPFFSTGPCTFPVHQLDQFVIQGHTAIYAHSLFFSLSASFATQHVVGLDHIHPVIEDILLAKDCHQSELGVMRYPSKDPSLCPIAICTPIADLALEAFGSTPPAVIFRSMHEDLPHYIMDITIPVLSRWCTTIDVQPVVQALDDNSLSDHALAHILGLYSHSLSPDSPSISSSPPDTFSAALSDAVADALSDVVSDMFSDTSSDAFYFDTIANASPNGSAETPVNAYPDASAETPVNAFPDASVETPVDASSDASTGTPANASPDMSLDASLDAFCDDASYDVVDITSSDDVSASPRPSVSTLSECSWDSLSESSWDHLLSDSDEEMDTVALPNPAHTCVILAATESDRAVVWAYSFEEACLREEIDYTSAVYTDSKTRPLYEQILLVRRALNVMEGLGARVMATDGRRWKVQDLGALEFADGTVHEYSSLLHNKLRWNISTFNIKLDLYRKVKVLTGMDWNPAVSVAAHSNLYNIWVQMIELWDWVESGDESLSPPSSLTQQAVTSSLAQLRMCLW